MNRILTIFIAAFMAFTAFAAHRQALQDWNVDNASLTREGPMMTVRLTIDFTSLDVPSEEALLFTPILRCDTDSIILPSVGVYGRNRYIHYQRQGDGMISGATERTFRNKEKGDSIVYSEMVRYADWMNGASLRLRVRDYGCCFTMLGERTRDLAGYEEITFGDLLDHPIYRTTAAIDTIVGTLEGSAAIQFVVNRTEIEPLLADNPAELGKIIHSIDTVAQDPDLTITSVWLKGFASPESPYDHNEKLARGRVDALRDYLLMRYPSLSASVFTTEYEPEDWAALRRYVEASSLPHRAEILALIDRTDLHPDVKEWQIRGLYETEYWRLRSDAYPPLRHTEYRITYRVRHFTDVDEIKDRIHTAPQNLTLNDFHLAANTYAPGSDEFREVYDIAVRMYPDSEIANLNAANAALQSGQLDAADRFLAKAGDTPESRFSRGIILIQREQYPDALPLIEQAVADGIPNAPEILAVLQRLISYQK